MTIAALQARWGMRVVGQGLPGGDQIAHIPTGFPALDKALGIGGLPRGRLSQIAGQPTSGMATLALKLIANAQSQGDAAVYLDVDHALDPHYAARCGVELARLVLARPHSTAEALTMLPDFFAGDPPGVLVVDAAQERLQQPAAAALLASSLDRLLSPLARTACALIFLTALPVGKGREPPRLPSGSPLAHYTAARLLLRRERWLYRRRDIGGYRAQVVLVKNKLAATAGRTAEIAITFNDVVSGGGP